MAKLDYEQTIKENENEENEKRIKRMKMRKMNKSRGMKTGKMPFGLADNKRGVTKGVVIQKVWKRKRVISQRGQPQELIAAQRQ